MKAFLDTSSVLKLYHQEDGTEALVTSLSTGIRPLYLSELAVLEFRSAVWKKTRTREIDTLIAKQVIAGFQRDFVKFQWIRLDSKPFRKDYKRLQKAGKQLIKLKFVLECLARQEPWFSPLSLWVRAGAS